MKAVIAIILGVIGLLMSTCGLAFIGFSLPGGASGVAPIALPSIVIGGLMAWGGFVLWRSWRRSKAMPAASSVKTEREP